MTAATNIIRFCWPAAWVKRLRTGYGPSAIRSYWNYLKQLYSVPVCPGDAILKAMDQAQEWRDQGRCIISGFHSPIEKECLTILLRGWQPIIIFPARSLENMRVPKDWKPAIEEGRLLLLSRFPVRERRMTAKLAKQRNQMVAALVDEAYFAYIRQGGRINNLSKQIAKWGVPITGY